MKALVLSVLVLILGSRPASAADHFWQVVSPQHAQTFTFGSEQGRQWIQRGNHLGLVIHFTNDPYVDRYDPRQYDDFEFDFPSVTLGSDRRTFYYHPAGRPSVPAAVRHPGIFGADVSLLTSSQLLIEKPHGLLTLTLLVSAPEPTPATSSHQKCRW